MMTICKELLLHLVCLSLPYPLIISYKIDTLHIIQIESRGFTLLISAKLHVNAQFGCLYNIVKSFHS